MAQQMTLFDAPQVETVDAMKGSLKYSRNVLIPQYLPSEECPHIESLVMLQKYNELLGEINRSNVSEEEKKFLRLAASRHLVFNYSLIADYYAHASKEMQELMEKSALVIIDIDDAIANGYVKMSKRLEEIRRDGNLAKKARDFE